MGFARLRKLIEPIPACPFCGGPCTHDFERSDYAFPDRLPVAPPERRTGDPDVVPHPRANLRGRRPEHHAPGRPVEDRARRPEADR